MSNCLICHRHEADEDGSHIISRFLLESMYNDGAKGSNKEQSFQMGAEGSTVFFGQAVLPEAIEQTLGREMADDDIYGITNTYVRDKVFCVACEKKLSFFESLYKRKVALPLARGSSLTESQLRIAYFFWLTIIYRWAATGFGHLQIEVPTLVELAIITNEIVVSASSEPDIEQNCLSFPISFNLSIGYLPIQEDNGRQLVFSHPEKQDPYLLSVNEYILTFNYQQLEQVAQLETELGINLGVVDNGVSFKVFSVAEREVMITSLWRIATPYLAQQFKDIFIERYTEQHGHSPHPTLLDAFYNEFTQMDLLAATKFSTKRQAQLMQKYLFLT